MGKLAILLVSAAIVVGGYAMSRSAQSSQSATERQAERQEEQAAREIAKSAYNDILARAHAAEMNLQKGKKNGSKSYSIDQLVDDVNGGSGKRTGTLLEGTYEAWLEQTSTYSYEAFAIGRYGDAEHSIGGYRQNYMTCEEAAGCEVYVEFIESQAGYCSAIYLERVVAKNNNGHGNNEDGVDSSNPGKSKKGEDSDPTVDDETKGGGSYASKYDLVFRPGKNRDGESAKWSTTLKKDERINVVLAVDSNCSHELESIAIDHSTYDHTRRALQGDITDLNDMVEGPYAMIEEHPTIPGLWRIAFEDLDFDGERDGMEKLADVKKNSYGPGGSSDQYWREVDGTWTYGGSGWIDRNTTGTYSGYYTLKNHWKNSAGKIVPDFSDQVIEVEMIAPGGTRRRAVVN